MSPVPSWQRGSASTWEIVLVGIVCAADPAAALLRGARDRRLPVALRRALAGANVDGVRIAALLVAKLRFERLLRGSSEIDAAFERDPQGFTELFRRYHEEVPLTAFDPPAEVRSFCAWQAGQSRKLPARQRSARGGRHGARRRRGLVPTSTSRTP